MSPSMKTPKEAMAAKPADIDENGLSMGEVISIKVSYGWWSVSLHRKVRTQEMAEYPQLVRGMDR
ncbi:hypothetical protein AtubIFM57258_005614 [Aspergillus tubingensis]|nr:hypothetical protein AtubIFM57258_005614 [Aspergillus tubingensis]